MIEMAFVICLLADAVEAQQEQRQKRQILGHLLGHLLGGGGDHHHGTVHLY